MAIRLGEILIERGIITPEDLDRALQEKRPDEPLGQTLVRLGIISERRLMEFLAEQQGLMYVNLKDIEIPERVIKSVPAKFAWHYKIVPIRLEGDLLTIAISDPFDMWPLEDIETNLGYRTEKVLSTPTDIMEAIKKYYGVGADTVERILAEDLEKPKKTLPPEKEIEDLERLAEDASVIRLVNQILQQAIDDRATDVHFERFSKEVILRYRVDGLLYNMQSPENIEYLYSAIITRIKVMSGLDILERRLPQDGRCRVRFGGDEYDLRVSVIPTLYGENVVVRILPTKMVFSLSDLGMGEKDLDTLKYLINQPCGLIFVTGPTGSGKTTTLYASLSQLNTRDRKIITVEDPVEYELKGVSQIQVNPKIGLSFAHALRSILRHDPDIMMVGEVRDVETAQIAIQAALTGHLVFSTLHTNDAVSGITRLIDMGIEPFLITSAVRAFIAQRLVRVLCGRCKRRIRVRKDKIGIEVDSDLEEVEIYEKVGCAECNNIGYKGRTGIYEILVLTETVKELITKRASSGEIKREAIKAGMKTLQMDGWNKVLNGITTVEEVIRVTKVG